MYSFSVGICHHLLLDFGVVRVQSYLIRKFPRLVKAHFSQQSYVNICIIPLWILWVTFKSMLMWQHVPLNLSLCSVSSYSHIILPCTSKWVQDLCWLYGSSCTNNRILQALRRLFLMQVVEVPWIALIAARAYIKLWWCVILEDLELGDMGIWSSLIEV